MSTELETVSKALTDINAVSTGIADLKTQYGGVVYEVVTTVGMDEAKAARLAIRTPRYEVERIRKAAKAPLLALGKRLDAEAARIEGELLQIERPIDQQIKAEEDRKERERQAKIDAEVKRVADLQERVAELRGCQTLSPADGSELIAGHITDLDALIVDDSFQEFEQQAKDAKAAGLARLNSIHLAAIVHEAEQARIKAELEELGRLREAAAVRAAQEKAARDEADRVAKVARDAETARHAEQLRKQREEQEAAAKVERMRIADEAEAARKLVEQEDARLAAERADLMRQQEELRKAQEQPKTAAVTRRGVAVKAPSAGEIVDVLAKHFKAHPDTIIDWLQQTDFAQVKAA
jgi:colicin import membrane protein